MKILPTILAVSILQTAAVSQINTDTPDKQEIAGTTVKLLRKAIALIDSGYLDRSLVCLDSVIRYDPSRPDAYFYKARILCWQGDSAAAVNTLAEAVEKSPRSTRLKITLARLYLSRGDLEKAWVQIDKALAIKPGDGETLFLKGNILEKQGDIDKALQMYKKAVAVSLSRIR